MFHVVALSFLATQFSSTYLHSSARFGYQEVVRYCFLVFRAFLSTLCEIERNKKSLVQTNFFGVIMAREKIKFNKKVLHSMPRSFCHRTWSVACSESQLRSTPGNHTANYVTSELQFSAYLRSSIVSFCSFPLTTTLTTFQ